MREQGPDVSMAAIAARAGISKPILYRHFGDRGGLFAALAARHAERLVARLETAIARDLPPRERIHGTVTTYLAFLESDPALHRVATRTAPIEGAGQRIVADALGRVCEEVVAAVAGDLAGRRLDPGPARTWGEGMVGMVQLVGDRWIAREPRPPRATVVDEVTDLLWLGFGGLAAT